MPDTPKDQNTKALALLERDLEVREKEFEVRSQEQEIQRENNVRNYEMSKDLNEKNFELMKTNQQHLKSFMNLTLLVIIIVFLGVLAFAIICLLANKENVLLEFGKYALAALGGGGAGYTLGANKNKLKKIENPAEEIPPQS